MAEISNNDVQAQFATCVNGGNFNCSGEFSGALGAGGQATLDIETNTPALIQLSGECESEDTDYGFGGSCTAVADPMVQIDPSFTQSGYSLEFSPDLGGSATATPEPPGYLLLLSGLGLMAFVVRSSRRLQVAQV
jgi:hypothetical protein